MEQQTSGIDRDFIISFFLPDGMIDWFEVVNMTEENNPGTTIADKLYNRILNIYLDEQYGLFLKMTMDSLPLTAALLGKLFPIKGSDIERYYKHHLSDYEVWTQKEHATDWVLFLHVSYMHHLRLSMHQAPTEVFICADKIQK